jgi:16S rRNA (cytidine1402-2'-O)-methyltransferase
MAGTLYVVGTPIGNLDDVSLRALRVFRHVAFIAAEDAQAAQRLLTHYAIETPVTGYQNHNKAEKVPLFLRRLQEGQSMALVCDAGTPAVFDPGSFLIDRALQGGIAVAPIPGPSAAVTAMSVSGFEGDAFVVHGPVAGGRIACRRLFHDLKAERRHMVLFVESRRLRAILEAVHVGLGVRRMTLAKNLTKPDEKILRGTAAQLLRKRKDWKSGDELTLVIEGSARGRKTAGKEKRVRRRSACESSRGRSSRRPLA